MRTLFSRLWRSRSLSAFYPRADFREKSRSRAWLLVHMYINFRHSSRIYYRKFVFKLHLSICAFETIRDTSQKEKDAEKKISTLIETFTLRRTYNTDAYTIVKSCEIYIWNILHRWLSNSRIYKSINFYTFRHKVADIIRSARIRDLLIHRHRHYEIDLSITY